nr:aminoglycoside phosphotransferase family protein [Micromonospora sp. DSM 115978]
MRDAGIGGLPECRISGPGQASFRWLSGASIDNLDSCAWETEVGAELGSWTAKFHSVGRPLNMGHMNPDRAVEEFVTSKIVSCGLSVGQNLGAFDRSDRLLRACWVHGDLSPGNVIVRPGSRPLELVGVIDWEYMYRGLPVCDVVDAL